MNWVPKISVIGSGQIGSTIGLLAGAKELGHVQLLDIVDGLAKGKALDLSHLGSIEEFDALIKGSTDYSELSGSDVVIVTAGVPRKPGMSRDDLLSINAKIVRSVAAAIKQHCASAFVICITNPLDVMVQLLQRESGVDSCKVVGMGGVLDAGRMRHLLSQKLGVSKENIHAMVMGGHGDTMVPLPRFTTVGGLNLPELVAMSQLTQEDVAQIVEDTRNGGAEIVQYLKTGSAFYAPASAAVLMAESYIKDKGMMLPCAAMLNGEYGVSGLYMGVPVVINKKGVDRIVHLRLNDEERIAFDKSVAAVQSLVDQLDALDRRS